MMRWWTALAVAAAFLLAGCLFLPGKFSSSLDIGKGGKFAFAYKGEIVIIAPDNEENNSPFKPDESCYDSKRKKDRKCTAAEIEEQRKSWQQSRDEAKKATQMMRVSTLGFDPDDKAQMDAFLTKISTNKGWKSISYRGKGIFDVDYAVEGTLDHDFAFPVIPEMSLAKPFIYVRPRSDGTISISGQGLLPDTREQSGFGAMMAAEINKADGKDDPGLAQLGKVPSGTFTVTTTGTILTNNTESGPTDASGRKRLQWQILPSGSKTPEALIRPN